MIQIIVFLYAGKDGLAGLREYESRVMPILREHGGVLISASSPIDPVENSANEIHVIHFPDMDAFEDYKKDLRHESLAELRKSAIRKTELFISEAFHEYK